MPSILKILRWSVINRLEDDFSAGLDLSVHKILLMRIEQVVSVVEQRCCHSLALQIEKRHA